MVAKRASSFPAPSATPAPMRTCVKTGCRRSRRHRAGVGASCDIDIEGSTVHRAVKQPGSGQLINGSPAMKVWVRQWPKGASASRRAPQGDLPRRRVSLVVTAVSSIKTNLCGSSRILGWRRCRHSYRAARTRLRRLSVAIKDFFICVTEPVLEEARQLCRSGPHIVFLNKRLGQFRHRNVWPAIHCCLEKPRKHFQSAAAFWSAPLGWCDGTRLSAALPNPHGTRR